MTHKKIQVLHAGRQCLNKKYGLSLEREDCLYFIYPGKCKLCGEVHNIVADIRWTRRWKLLFR